MGEVIFNRIQRKTRHLRPESEWVRVAAHDAIVSAEVFNIVQAGLARRAPVAERESATSQHSFTGLLRCAHCDSSLQIATGTGRGGKTYSYYACRSNLQGQRCAAKQFRADKFDAWMLEQLLTKVLTREVVQAVIDQLDELTAEWVQGRGKRRFGLVLELRAAESRRRNIYDVIEVGGKGAPGLSELGPRIAELNDQIGKLERTLVELDAEPEPAANTLNVTADEAVAVFREALARCDDPKRMRAFLATITDRIIVGPDEIEVHYKPDCLILADGQPVHSKLNWLPDLGSNQGPTD